MILNSFNNYYTISIDKNYLYISNYIDILSIKDNLISIKFNNFQVNIKGSNLCVSKMLDNEILIKGIIFNMEFNYD